MTSCFFVNCRDPVAYRCRCNNGETFVCLAHLGVHFTSKGEHVHESVMKTVAENEASPLVMKLGLMVRYLTEVQAGAVAVAQDVIQAIKGELARFSNVLQRQQQSYQRLLESLHSDDRKIHPDESSSIVNFRCYSLLRGFSHYAVSAKQGFADLLYSISMHCKLGYAKSETSDVQWDSAGFGEMRKAAETLQCAACAGLRPETEFWPGDLGAVCLICAGALGGWPPPGGGHRWGSEERPWKKHHGGHHGGHHGKHKHPPPPHMQFPPPSPMQCPPHARPMCPFAAFT
jgi:hypothetical protein